MDFQMDKAWEDFKEDFPSLAAVDGVRSIFDQGYRAGHSDGHEDGLDTAGMAF